ncbi:MAG: hypothetical protein WBO29_09340 [Albidovulum sp.]
MDAKEYAQEILEPVVSRYLREQASKELAFAACILSFHFVEYAAKSLNKERSEIENDLRSQGYEFDVVHAVAVAAKHTSADNQRLTYHGLKEADCMIATGHAFSDGTYFSDGTSYADHEDSIRVQTPDGNFHDLAFILPRLVNHIRSTLQTASNP